MRQRERKSPAVLVMTFMIGFAIGFTTCYALFKAPLPNLADVIPDVVEMDAPRPDTETTPAVTPVAEKPSKPAPDLTPGEAQPPVETPAPTPEEQASLAELEAMADTWPARHLFVGVDGLTLAPEAQAFLAELKPGGVVLRDGNIRDTEQTIALVRQIKQAVGLGMETADLPLIVVSQEGGAANPLKLLIAPGPGDLGRAYDPVAASVVGGTYAQECLARGIGVLFAPVLDMADPEAPAAVTDRCFGTERLAVAALGMAFADGAAAAGVIPVAKYYPGGRGASPKKKNAMPALDGDIPAVARAMFPFNEAIPCGVPGIMVGHIAVPALDPGDPPRPASLSPVLVRTNLRGRLKFDGVIISDDLSAECITRGRAMAQAAVQALVAGCDALVVADASQAALREVCDAIQDAIDAGGLSIDELANSKRRLAAWQTRLRNPAPLTRPLPELPPKLEEAPAPPKADKPAAPAPEEAPVAPETPAAPGAVKLKKIVHEIQPGDMLSRLAVKYGVSQDDIMKWNNLTDKNLKYGFNLIIHVPEKADAEAPVAPQPAAPEAPAPEPEPEVAPAPAEAPEPAPEQADEPEPAPKAPAEVEEASAVVDPVVESPQPSVETPPTGEMAGPRKIVHEVKPGEMLSRLAVKYGVSQDDIIQWNDLKDKNLKIGQSLTIHIPGESEIEAPDPSAVAIPEPEAAKLTEVDAPDETPQEVEEVVTVAEPPAGEAPAEIKAAQEMAEPAPAGVAVIESAETPPGMKKIVHEVRPGEMLSRLAVRYGVSQDDIIKWNNLANKTLKYGFNLIIYVPEGFEVPPAVRPAVKEVAPPPGTRKEVYTIKQGDALSVIAQRYGVSQQDIITWNNLTADNIKHGFTLTIYVPVTRAESALSPAIAVYTVVSGDTVASIAERFGLPVQELLRLNGLQEGFALQEGQQLKVPSP
jgi:beta-N-acetylhexosaminidase